MSSLGLFHTGVSLLALGSGTYAFWRDGQINPRNSLGKFYLGTMLVATLTAFGIFRHGTFGVGHMLSLVTLGILTTGILASYSTTFGRLRDYVETISYSASYLMLMVFATTETLTRLPAAHPIAASQEAPILGVVRLGLLIAFAVGLSFQIPRLQLAHNRKDA
ncbi:MAG: hypothetical protein V4719_27360 [Planctomycetota bacterium]